MAEALVVARARSFVVALVLAIRNGRSRFVALVNSNRDGSSRLVRRRCGVRADLAQCRAEKLDRDETEPENGDAFPDDLPANQFQYALHLFGWNHSRFQPLIVVFAWLYCQVLTHRSSLSSC